MRFAKLHGLGNDFILVDKRGAGARAVAAELESERAAFAIRACDRHFGIGADGVLSLYDADRPGAATLVIHNPDGSRPEMCGNGVRCAALWMISKGCTEPGRGEVLLLTEAGPRPCSVVAETASLGFVEVGMGPPRVEADREATLLGEMRPMIPVSMGNPHRVFFLDLPGVDALRKACAAEGPALCRSEDANIELVNSLGHQRFAASVWERGAGQTLACGTGACAVAAAAISRKLARADEPITVELPGGPLKLHLRDGQMMMRGPAELVFRGDY